MLVEAVFDASWDGIAVTKRLLRDMEELLHAHLGAPGLRLSVISMSRLYSDCIEHTMLDMARLDSISITLGLIIVAIFVR